MKTTRKEAKLAGDKKYFTGNPCKHGHVSPRLVSNAACCECDKIRKSATRKNKTERVSEVIDVVEVKQVRVVTFNPRPDNKSRYGFNKFNHEIVSDELVSL